MKLLLWTCVVAVCLTLSTVKGQDGTPCTGICDVACDNSATCFDIPGVLDCNMVSQGCAAFCKQTCGCFQTCVSTCARDNDPCVFEQGQTPNTFTDILCSYSEAICDGFCVSNCPGQVFFDFLKATVGPLAAS
ncbi:uncharacterized protein LOC106013371 [Aplysia californica]|uniref:Uncharacterized protein LOC106013371 n=1 Tax=Aplysia californica TaxID=6500 RepID=A0ABM1AB67_APLCA|nr:uncharacterized protein LOC106013371 [Aplysia californica]